MIFKIFTFFSMLVLPLLITNSSAAQTLEKVSQTSSAFEKPTPEKDLQNDKLSTEKKSEEEADKKVIEAEKARAAKECRLCRWIDLQTATFAGRYRFVKSNQRVTNAVHNAQPFLPFGEFVKTNQAQQQQIYEFDFKFDKAGRYKIHTRLSSGEYFTRSFSEVGWGKDFNGEKGWNVLPRQFYFSAEPVKGIEFQYGGLGINRGENTENITYDNDGFLTGQRLKIKRPEKIWFSEVSVTYAYIGDFYTPNFFERAKRLKKANYYQYLVGKKFGSRFAFSADFTSHASIAHLHEALTVNTKELKFIDSFKAEFYQRLEDYRGVKKGWGYNFQVEKDVKDKFNFTAGLTFTDYRYNVLTTEKYPARQQRYAQPAGTLTADRMIRGLSPFVRWEYKFSPYTSVFGFWTSDLAKPKPLPFVYNSDHFSVGFQVNVKNILKKTGWF